MILLSLTNRLLLVITLSTTLLKFLRNSRMQVEASFMIMGGTVHTFLQTLVNEGTISTTQKETLLHFITYKNEDGMFDHQVYRDFTSFEESEIRQYLQIEVDSGRISRETSQYVAAFLNIDEDKNEPPPPSNPAGVAYNNTGNIVKLGQLNPDPPNINTMQRYNGIGGYATGMREYALQCAYNGLHIIDITVPSNPFRVQLIEMSGGIIWRDVDIFYDENSSKTYAYVGAQGGDDPTLHVIDLSFLSADHYQHESDSNPIPSTGIINLKYEGYAHTLNIQGGLLFLNSANSEKGCTILDISENPIQPKYVGSWNGTGHDCHDSYFKTSIDILGDGIHRDILFSSDGFSRKHSIVDITNIRSGTQPKLLGQTQYNSHIYAHQCVPTEDNRYLYTFDEKNYHDIGVWDISDLLWNNNASLVTSFQYSMDRERNSFVHNGIVMGNYLLVAYFAAGLRIYDISNPYNPIEIGKFDTYLDPVHGDGNNISSFENDDGATGKNKPPFVGAWNVYKDLPSGNILVSDQYNGLFIFGFNQITKPRPPTLSATIPISSSSTSAVTDLQQTQKRVTVQLLWALVDGATGYRVKRCSSEPLIQCHSINRSTGDDDTTIATNLVGTTYNDVITFFAEDDATTTYYYTVVAYNAEGDSDESNIVVIKDPFSITDSIITTTESTITTLTPAYSRQHQSTSNPTTKYTAITTTASPATAPMTLPQLSSSPSSTPPLLDLNYTNAKVQVLTPGDSEVVALPVSSETSTTSHDETRSLRGTNRQR